MRLTVEDFTEVAFRDMQQVHVDEIGMINDLYALLEQLEQGELEPSALDDKLDVWFEHTKAHFANEERLMQLYGFPPFPVHKQAHDLFLAEVTEVLAVWKSTRQFAEIADFLRHRLPTWMKEHIGSMDFVTAAFIASHQ